jgi:hypothetical protein
MSNDLIQSMSQGAMSMSARGLGELQAELARLSRAVAVREQGPKQAMTLGVLQMQRFLFAISQDSPPGGQRGVLPVITGRLKNSIFTEVAGQGDDLFGHVATNVIYAPPVEARRGFMERASREEGPRVAESFYDLIQGGQ